MRADNSHLIVAAAHRRATATRKRAVTALRRMDATGTPVTFEALAREAKVSRSWLCSQPDLRVEIERLRARNSPRSAPRPVPDRQRPTDASLLRRLEAATERVRQLEAQNKQLREALALGLRERRTADFRGTTGGAPRAMGHA